MEVKQEVVDPGFPSTSEAAPITLDSDTSGANTPEPTKAKPPPQPQQSKEKAPQAPSTSAADPVVGGAGAGEPEVLERKPTPKPEEFFLDHRTPVQKLATRHAVTVYIETVRQNPQPGDRETLDMTLVEVTKATVAGKRGSEAPVRVCWLRLPRTWVLQFFMQHLIGESNIRYRGVTYCSVCHHVSTQWDCHPMCWQCYLQYDLPLCGIDQDIICEHCNIMGSRAKAARVAKLKEVLRSSNPRKKMRVYNNAGGLPVNVFTQDDADWWAHEHNVVEVPNPDWLVKGAGPGSCFPYALIVPPQSIKDAVEAHPEWKQPDFAVLARTRNAKESSKKGDVKTPSHYNRVFLPACLVWDADVEEPPQTPPFETLSWLTPEQKAACTVSAAKQMSDEECVKALAERLIAYLQRTNQQQQQATGSVDDILASMHPDEVQQLLTQDATGVMTSALSLSDEDCGQLQAEQLRDLVKRCLKRLREQQTLLEHAQHRVEGQQRAAAQAAAAQDAAAPEAQQDDAAVLLYKSKEIEICNWTLEEVDDLNRGWMRKEPANEKLVCLCDQLKAMGVDLDWSERTEKDANGELVVHVSPKLAPEFLAEQWKVMGEMQESDPFDLQFSCPAEVAVNQGAGPAFDLSPTVIKADDKGKFPACTEVILSSIEEVEQLKRLSAAAGATNNLARVAARELAMRLEGVGTPLSNNREIERLLSSLVCEATATTNKLTTRVNALSTGFMRRDGMLRGSRDPSGSPNLFGNPMSWQLNYTRRVGPC